MDRRQRKTREAIFSAFIELLSKKDFSRITVGEIIDCADVGRATFYSHFETKDFLLKELCAELFCHIFDAENGGNISHRHIFDCDDKTSAFLHLFRHLKKNDNNILSLLSSRNNELFWKYFKKELEDLTEHKLSLFDSPKSKNVPESFWKNHIVSTFEGTLKWWIEQGTEETPEQITEYFFSVL